jgi:hypothetical protein
MTILGSREQLCSKFAKTVLYVFFIILNLALLQYIRKFPRQPINKKNGTFPHYFVYQYRFLTMNS